MEIKPLVIAACLAACADSAVAQNTTRNAWYAGLDLGNIDHYYTPEYTSANDDGSSSFRNTSDGVEVGLLAGLNIPVAQHFSVAVEARVAQSDSEWTLYLPGEPADFSYKIPTMAALSIKPVFKLNDRVGVFGELGFATGNIKERKSSPSADHSSYDFSEWVNGWAWGLGVAFQLSHDWSLQAVYRETDYNELDYKTYLPNGTHFESVMDSPQTEAYSIGVIYEF
jgi:opacity protein-like surface antigen